MATILIFAALLLTGSVSAEVSAPTTAPNDASISTYARIIRAFNTGLDQTVWPGFKFSTAPTLISYPSEIYAFDLKGGHSAWQPIEINGEPALFSAEDSWGVKASRFSPFFPVDGQLAYLFSPELFSAIGIPNFEYVAFVHERFHRHQFEHFKGMRMDRPAYRGHLSRENLALVYLENAILQDYLDSGNEDDLREFSAVNDLRMKGLDPKSRQWEEWQQRVEGIAEYVQIRTFEYLPLDGIDSRELHRKRARKYFALDEEGIDKIVKWRHYSVGATLGVALDHLGVKDWKGMIAEGRFSLAKLLKRSLHVTQQPSEKLVQQAKAKFNYEHLLLESDKIRDAYHSKISGIEEKYKGTPGIELVFDFSRLSQCSGGGISENTLYLPDGSTLSLDQSQSTLCADGEVTLNYQHVPVVFSGVTTRFKADKLSEILLDARKHTLQELSAECRSVPFRNVTWKTPGIAFESKKEGRLKCASGTLIFEFQLLRSLRNAQTLLNAVSKTRFFEKNSKSRLDAFPGTNSKASFIAARISNNPFLAPQ